MLIIYKAVFPQDAYVSDLDNCHIPDRTAHYDSFKKGSGHQEADLSLPGRSHIIVCEGSLAAYSSGEKSSRELCISTESGI